MDLVAESARREAVSFITESAAANRAHPVSALRGEVEVEEEPLWHAINYQRELFIHQRPDDFNMDDEPVPAAAEVAVRPAGSTGRLTTS